MVSGASFDELRGNAYRASNMPEAALDDILGAKLAANLCNVRRLALVRERGVARQHT